MYENMKAKKKPYEKQQLLKGLATELTTTKTRLQSILYTTAGRKGRTTHEKIPDEQRKKGLHSH